MTRTLGVAAIKAHLTGLLRDLERRGDTIVVQRRGTPIAVIRPYDANETVSGRGPSWVDAVEGVAGQIADFDRIMTDVTRARRRAGSRRVRLDD